MLETLGLIVFASLFVFSGVNHIRNHKTMVEYTTAAMGKCPFAKQLGYLGGWPTGLFLIVFGIEAAINDESVFLYGLAGFLVLATILFHRNFLKDPAGFKGVALVGAAVALATHVH